MWQQQIKQRRFAALLVILFVLLAGPPLVIGFGLSAAWFDGLMSAIMVAAIVSLCFERRQRIFALLLGIPSVLFALGSYLLPGPVSQWTLLLGQLCEVMFLFGSAALIVRSLFGFDQLSADTIFGAICGYVFLGLAWAVLYSMIEHHHAGSFASSGARIAFDGSGRPPADILTYYSFVTLTTVGYGDVVPVTAATRTCAWIEAACGQFYLAVIVAGLVSMLASRRAPMPPQDGHSGSA